ncbi:Acyl-CoA dehydrogenase [Collimonas arenae]|uniref:Acyl-CoA dehydrogenase n=1 Tax=Collimonas arenae TaxID=279058 RepID=A0A0A1FJN0_9BURK|nr:acyl-CoA dehydrogenase family protein [Collimonas arenae]AIY43107.1 Acyl-CoA dehydrogenase [Collimonas arenae]
MPDTPQTMPAIPDSHGSNLFTSDFGLSALLQVYLPKDVYRHLEPHLVRLGERAGGELDELASTADKNPPTLQHRTRSGQNVQKINKHPAYIALERAAYSELGLAAMTHRGGVLGWPAPFPPLAKYALTFLFVQAEFGLCCPVSMTDSLTSTLRKFGDPDLVARFLPNLTTVDFDELYQGAMFMTEQGAGSDVSRVATRAYRDGDDWKLAGDKWFCSNPDAGLAMVLARPDGAPAGIKGLGLFLLPKYLADGSRNHYRIIRLKDKMGSRSMASGEIQLEGATAYLVGELGRGFNQMADMINMSRLSNGVRAAGLMRRAVGEALFIARNRSAFGKQLIDMPLMQRQLIKMMLPAEQARSMFMQTASCMERADGGDQEAQKLVRILTPMIKFRACRDARKVTGDAMEVRGGCGYIEEWSDPRLVRDAHLGSIWEGTSNIVALDVVRSIKRDNTLGYLQDYLRKLLGAKQIPEASRALLTRTLDSVVAFVESVVDAPDDVEVRRAASALYHIATAIFFAWEAAQAATDWRRLAFSHLLLKHKLLPANPLEACVDPAQQAVLKSLFEEAPVSLAAAMSLLPA